MNRFYTTVIIAAISFQLILTEPDMFSSDKVHQVSICHRTNGG